MLSAKQERLLGALLSQPTVAQAAKAAGYTERGVYHLLTVPAFAAAYREARQQAVAQAQAQLQQAAAMAVVVLRLVAQDSKAAPSTRVAAAGKILDLAFRSGEDDTAERLAALEKMVADLATQDARKLRVV